ncbi:ParB-like nuclease domain protein [Bacillus pseudomycoides]|uniref:hypothetical protein n=1 Tax=Bacillus pseudomycoides TaxID=64104 RepID=UPI0001A15594|nr:hypothetical protein [Bacillus pseudomycoides]EEM08349.1 ParB-like nuclease domain protein [Bacillus pseudomycoides]
MGLKEQKLFFTRNGEYTVWEMLNTLNVNNLEELKRLVFEKKWLETLPRDVEQYPNYIFKAYNQIEGKNKENLYEEIKVKFDSTEHPKNDFNALIYYTCGLVYNDIEINDKLKNMAEETEVFGIDGLKINYFLHQEDNKVKFVDVRFSSGKTQFYKGTDIVQKKNTEIRVYLEFNTALMTNYSDYTHSDNEKNKFINIVLNCIFIQAVAPKTLVLSDQSLRNLLIMDNSHIPSKLKFEVEGRLKVDVDINHSLSFLETIYQDEVNFFYHKYPISVLKVKITERDEEKFLMIDGPKGKIMSRSQNIEIIDIDNFMKNLSKLFRYDFLNHSYEDDVKQLARRSLTGTINQKNNIVTACYKEIEKVLSTVKEDDTGVLIKILRNAFFYCLKENKSLGMKFGEYILTPKTTQYLSKIFNISLVDINGLLKSLIQLYETNDNLETLMQILDEKINGTRMIEDASGL